MEQCLITSNELQFKIHAQNWQEALSLAAKPLLDLGYIESAYVQDVINSVLTLGPYIVIAPGLALGHARPSAAVHRACVSIATLDQPVEFGSKENDPVDIVVILAATDDSAHMQLLQKIVTYLNEPDGFANLRAASTYEDAQAIVHAINEGE